MEQLKRIAFSSMMGGVEKINPEFAKVKIHIMYEGKNRNGSYFSRETIEKMIPTLFNVPVTGEYDEVTQNFKGHGGKIEMSEDGIRFIDTTRPYGVVPSDTEITWERIREKDGITEHEYLTCWAYLWYGRYPEIEKILNDKANQSMEISVHKAEWNDEHDAYEIKDANFSSLCILGRDSNPEKNYEPCFEGADIASYSLNKEKFANEFNEMINTLKMSLNKKEDERVENEKKLELFSKFPTLKEEDIADLKANLDNYSLEELENKLTELFNSQDDESNSDENNKEEPSAESESNDANFKLEMSNLKEQLQLKETTIFELNKQIQELTANFSSLELEAIELREYKTSNENAKTLAEKEKLFAEYSIGLSEEEMQPIKEKINEYSLDEIRIKLNEVYTNKSFSLLKTSKSEKEDEKEKEEIPMDFAHKSSTKSKYAVS